MPRKKKAPVPAVVRNPKTGRAEKPATQAPGPTTGLPAFVKPKEKPQLKSSLKKTRTGKKISGGKVAVPAVKIDPETKRLRATTEAEKTEARTTVLPDAPIPQEARPQGVMGMGAAPIRKGASSGSYPHIKAAVDAARTHLSAMAQNPIGSSEHHAAHEAFNAIHANIGKMSPELHTTLGQAKHFVTNPGKGSNELLAMTHKAINTRLNIIKAAHEENIRRADEGRNKKAGN
jgi:hypothetical protein